MNRVSLVLRNVEDSAGLKRLWFPAGVGKDGDCPMSLGKDRAEPCGAPKGHVPASFQTPTAGWAGAEHGGNPEVGGAGVEDHGEFLGWGPDGDGAKVLILSGRGWKGLSGIGKGSMGRGKENR